MLLHIDASFDLYKVNSSRLPKEKQVTYHGALSNLDLTSPGRTTKIASLRYTGRRHAIPVTAIWRDVVPLVLLTNCSCCCLYDIAVAGWFQIQYIFTLTPWALPCCFQSEACHNKLPAWIKMRKENKIVFTVFDWCFTRKCFQCLTEKDLPKTSLRAICEQTVFLILLSFTNFRPSTVCNLITAVALVWKLVEYKW